jgi:hypothetical protein
MRLTGRLGNRRGITPVLSNVLLTVIAVAAMSLAASATYVITNNMRELMGERVIVEDVWFNQDQISVYLHNTGKVAIEVTSVYLNFTSQPSTRFVLEIDQHGWLNVTCNWGANAMYHINVVTSRGTKIADYYKAPA